MNWTIVTQIAKFSPIILPRIDPGPSDPVEARLQDIEYLGRLLRYDRSFDDAARREFETLLESHKGDAATMTDADFLMLGRQAAALADNGHTSMSLAPLRRDFNNVGVRYYVFADGVYVVRAKTEHAVLIGGRVEAIDGEPIDATMTALSIYTGGTEGWRTLVSLNLMESAELLHAAGLTESASGYTLTITDQQGGTQDVELVAYMPDPGDVFVDYETIRNLDPQTLPDEGDNWVTALQDLSAEDVPLYLQDQVKLFKWEALQDGGGYVRVQANVNGRDQTMAEFFEENLGSLPDGSLNYLVVDFRGNPGGNTDLFVEPSQWLPDKVTDDGHICIVVGPQTFSAGVNSSAQLKYYGGEKSMIIGEPMGDREQYWAERGTKFHLPNSGYRVNYATAYHDWANRCDDHPYCFTQALLHGVAAGSLALSHIIEPTYADYSAGRDVVMEWIYDQELP